jgi:branched-chain amino acid transport system substrate-binding protein
VRHSRRMTASAIASTLFIAGLTGCGSGDDSGSRTDVVIGADLTVGSSVDDAYARALQLKIDQLNASGALGNKRLVLHSESNRADPTASLRNVDGFADDASVAAVIVGSCATCLVDDATAINTKKIPTIALSPSFDIANPLAKRQYIFKLGANPDDSAATLVTELVRKKTIKHAALLYTQGLYGSQDFSAMKSALVKAGISADLTQTVPASTTNLTSAVTALTTPDGGGKAPDVLIAMVSPDQVAATALGAKAAGFPGSKLYFDAGSAGDTFVPTEASKALNNATMVFTQSLAVNDVVATTPAKASRQQWFRDYTSRYGDYSGVATFAADAVDLIASAVIQAGNDRDQIRNILETSQTDGLSGAIRFTPDNHSGLMPQSLTLLVVRSGRWRIAS